MPEDREENPQRTERLDQLFETMATAVVYHDREGRIIEANPAAERILGRSVDELRRVTGRDLGRDPIRPDGTPFPDDERPVEVALREAVAVSDVVMGVHVPGRDGRRWIRISAVPCFRPGESAPHEVVTTFDDVTDLVRAERAAQESEEKLRSVLESSPMGIHMYRLEPDGRLIFTGANATADAILGVDNSRFVGLTIEEAFPPLTQTEVPWAYRRVAREGGRWNREEIAYRDRQLTGAFEVHAFRTAPNRMAALFLDITSRKRAEEELRRSREQLSMALEATGMGTWQLDLASRRVTVDERWATIIGLPPEDLPTSSEGYLALHHPEDLEEVRRRLRDHLEGRTPAFEHEHRLRRASGEWVWVQSRGRVMERDEEGRPRHVVGTCVDITGRRRAEAERAGLQAQMQQAQKLESLGILAGGVAHDFNNLLCGVVGAADLALEDLSSQHPVRMDLEQIREAGQRATELCRQLLAYSGRGRFVVEPLDLSEVVEAMGHLLQISISKKVELRYDLERDLPAVDADATQLRQVILNLIVNASEAIGEQEGTVTLSTGVKPCDRDYLRGAYIDDELPPGRYVSIEVADTGSGMSPDTLRRLFDPFFTTKFTGRGLGLAATLGIVRGHSGTIKVRSAPGEGTSFEILLPASSAQRSAPTLMEDRRWHGSGTVLLVDDEETARAVGRRMLERLGFEVLLASDGVAALEVLRGHDEIGLVLLDLTMPRLGGEETLRELRGLRADVPVLLTSGYNEQESVGRFAGKGLAGFIQKPFQLGALREAVRAALEGKR